MSAAHDRLTARHGRITTATLMEIGRDPEATEQDRLNALTVIERMRADLNSAEYALLDGARRTGTGWSALGAALGVTRQGAERRWLRGAPKATPSRDADAGRRDRRRLA
ncbi:hypothetical protein KIK06_29070 [Nocardiopsis sp. EMB25]|uniref:hypothetical protein n=1 Tax=Nocardiopsis sp. EMB25 TaxID=2835867 RepID=UPI0022844D24|nr:hypothetical protein [Nocardiopsis sp. EMB25]MCY9787934.1 hypothetical protein [Nocardiopsis sp. EMB25]MCY9787936.1 hypothetical protein [Nocardiopsis sp. EMB25]